MSPESSQLVKTSRPVQRLLLVTSNSAHESDLWTALQRATSQRPDLQFELTYLDLSSALDFIAIFSSFDRLRSGYFAGCTLRLRRARGHVFVTPQVLGSSHSDPGSTHWVCLSYILKPRRKLSMQMQSRKCAAGSSNKQLTAHRDLCTCCSYFQRIWEMTQNLAPRACETFLKYAPLTA